MRKRLWLILGIIVGIAVISVMAYCVFSIGKVDVNTTIDIAVLSQEEKDEIIALSGIKKGKNIFAIDEDIAIENIEKSFAYAQSDFYRAYFSQRSIYLRDQAYAGILYGAFRRRVRNFG